jgi:hypothetical protein
MTFAMNNEHPRLWLEELHKKSARKEQLRAAMQEALGCLTSVAHVEVAHVTGHKVVSFDLEKEWPREISGLRAAMALLDE